MRSLCPGLEDTLAGGRVVPLLRGRFGSPYRFHASCPSTQLLLRDDDPEGTVVAADEQTQGRGRRGRQWQADAGLALLVSVLLRPPRIELAPQLSLVGGLATALTVEAELSRPAGLKWPNDVLVDGRKVAGVLAEGRAGAIVLGIGLNVNQGANELPGDARTPAASLRVLDGRPRDRGVVLAMLLLELEHAYDRWQEGGLAALHGELARRDCLAGQEVAVGDVHGTAVGIGLDGRLVVRTGTHEVAVASGEVGEA